MTETERLNLWRKGREGYGTLSTITPGGRMVTRVIGNPPGPYPDHIMAPRNYPPQCLTEFHRASYRRALKHLWDHSPYTALLPLCQPFYGSHPPP